MLINANAFPSEHLSEHPFHKLLCKGHCGTRTLIQTKIRIKSEAQMYGLNH